MTFKLIFAACLALTLLTKIVSAFTDKEKEAIDKLRSAIGDKLTQDFMKTDEYLLRWLVAKNMDVKKAEEMLEKSLSWRKENNIDSIMSEDFNQFQKQFVYKLDAVDKDGRPVVYLQFGHWVIRKVATTGQLKQLVRYMIKAMLEEPRIKAEEFVKNGKSKDTRFVMLIDISGFNLKEHACLACFGLYTQFVQLYENNYPESAYKVIAINAPTIFETILEVIRPIMSPATKRDFSIHGIRKADWKPEVLKLIDAEQIPAQYGGSKKASSG